MAGATLEQEEITAHDSPQKATEEVGGPKLTEVERKNILRNAKWEFRVAEAGDEPLDLQCGDEEVSVLKKQIQQVVVPSESGDVHVTIEGDTNNPHAIFTYPDVGLNHITCYRTFFSFCGHKSVFRHFTLYHIEPPGHHIGAEEIPDDAPQVTLHDLADQVEAVRAHYGVENIVAFGTGVGASVWLHYVLKYEKWIRGLVLTCPTPLAPTYYQKSTTWLILWRLWRWGLTDYMKRKLLMRWFSFKTHLLSKDVVNGLNMEIDKMQAKNIYRYFVAYINREDIREQLKECSRNFKTLLISGDEYQPETLELNACLRPENNTWMEIENCGTVMTEEQPEAMASPLTLFLNGMGYI